MCCLGSCSGLPEKLGTALFFFTSFRPLNLPSFEVFSANSEKHITSRSQETIDHCVTIPQNVLHMSTELQHQWGKHFTTYWMYEKHWKTLFPRKQSYWASDLKYKDELDLSVLAGMSGAAGGWYRKVLVTGCACGCGVYPVVCCGG